MFLRREAKNKKGPHFADEGPLTEKFTRNMVNFKFNFGEWLNISGKELKGTDLISVLAFLAFCIGLGAFFFSK